MQRVIPSTGSVSVPSRSKRMSIDRPELSPAARVSQRACLVKRFLIRLALALLLGAIALYPLYLVAGNWYLRSGDLERRLNRRPERLLIEAGTAWTLWPGIIHVRDFRIRNQTRTAQWWGSID